MKLYQALVVSERVLYPSGDKVPLGVRVTATYYADARDAVAVYGDQFITLLHDDKYGIEVADELLPGVREVNDCCCCEYTPEVSWEIVSVDCPD